MKRNVTAMHLVYLDLQYSRFRVRLARAIFTLSILQGIIHAGFFLRRLKRIITLSRDKLLVARTLVSYLLGGISTPRVNTFVASRVIDVLVDGLVRMGSRRDDNRR